MQYAVVVVVVSFRNLCASFNEHTMHHYVIKMSFGNELK